MVNPDEGEQKRILRIIYDNWTVDTEDPKGLKIPEDPLSYWTTLISDDYAETVENIFYFSFLCKQSIVKGTFLKNFTCFGSFLNFLKFSKFIYFFVS